MVDVRTDDEQLEMVKKFFKNYGWSILLGIVLALGLSYGWRYWRGHKIELAQQASIRYEQMLTAYVDDRFSQFQGLATELEQNYHRTPYAQLAALMQAKYAVDQGKLTDALAKLQWVISNNHSAAITQVARIRAARVLLALKKPNEALKLLQSVNDKAYMPAINYVRGDIYLALGEKMQAREAFSAAATAIPKTAVLDPIVQMKLDALAPTHNT